MVTNEWIRPESLSTPICTYRFAGLRLHSVVPLIALLWSDASPDPTHRICFLVELGAEIKVASMIMTCFMVIPLCLRCALNVSSICWLRSCFSSKCRNVRIVYSTGIRSRTSAILAKWRMVFTSIRGSSMAKSLSEYHCYWRLTRSMVSMRIKRTDAFLSRFGVERFDQVDQRLQTTSSSISQGHSSRWVCFLAVMSS